MNEIREHSHVRKLKEELCEGRVSRREFLCYSTLLGLSASAAYAFVGKVSGQNFIPQAQAAKPMGGQLIVGHRIQDLATPHTYSWAQSEVTRQVCEHLTRTGSDNVTRPNLVEQWEASDDLKTWTLHLRKDVTWRKGRQFVADDVIANIEHALDPATGSSIIGLMQGYMLEVVETGEKDDEGNAKTTTKIWDANALEKIDDHTVRINCKAPQVAVPEHLFHYPFHMMDPEEGFVFDVGSNGTGAFEMVEYRVGEQALITRARDHWREGPYVDAVRYVDLGDDSTAWLGALASKQVHGVPQALDVELMDSVRAVPHLKVYSVTTAQTAVARTRVTEKPFDNAKLRKAMRLAVDTKRVLELAYRNLGSPGEHHHVSPIHPEYAELAFMERDVEAAKATLAEAGYPDGIDLKIDCKATPTWELAAVQAMAEQWKEAGIRVTINVMPGATYWDIWDQTPFGFTNWTHRPLGIMVLGLAYRSGVPWNESAYSNAEFDALLNTAEGTLDLDERREILAKLETIMQEDGPIVQPLWRATFTAFDKKVVGFSMHPTSYFFAEEVAIET